MKRKLLVLFFISGLVGFNLLGWWREKEEREKKVRIKEEVVFWKKVVAQKKEYPDGWVKLGLAWYREGKVRWAKLSLAKARRLDPLREEIREIQAWLEKKP